MVTRWSPDTCECIIEYNDDLSLSKVVHACPAHQGDNEETIYQNVKEENPRKNQSLKEILDNAPPGLFEIDPDSGARVFKKGVNVDFSWEGKKPNRKLNLAVKGTTLTPTQLNAVKTKLNNKFGSDKVNLVQG